MKIDKFKVGDEIEVLWDLGKGIETFVGVVSWKNTDFKIDRGTRDKIDGGPYVFLDFLNNECCKGIRNLSSPFYAPESFESQLARAKALIGKKCQYCDGRKAIVSSLAVATAFGENLFEAINQFWVEPETNAKSIFEKNGGWLIALRASGVDFTLVNALQNVSEVKEEEWESVVVNGYKAERMAETKSWKFGCAYINFKQMIYAGKLIVPYAPHSNRTMTKITFGIGEFTAEQIQILAKYSV